MRVPLCLAICATSALTPHPAQARNDTWDKTGSIARDALVVTALALPAAKGDWKGELQALASVGVTFLITTAMKETIKSERPDHSDRRSFPSGHTSAAFAAAATLHNRYGWKVGLPAQALAAFVGISRIEAKRHHWYDVVAGAAIGEGTGLLLTSKLRSDVRILPWGDTQSGGVSLSMRF